MGLKHSSVQLHEHLSRSYHDDQEASSRLKAHSSLMNFSEREFWFHVQFCPLLLWKLFLNSFDGCSEEEPAALTLTATWLQQPKEAQTEKCPTRSRQSLSVSGHVSSLPPLIGLMCRCGNKKVNTMGRCCVVAAVAGTLAEIPSPCGINRLLMIVS